MHQGANYVVLLPNPLYISLKPKLKYKTKHLSLTIQNNIQFGDELDWIVLYF